MKDFDKIIREKGLPEVGQEVRSKKYGTSGGSWRRKKFGPTSCLTPRAARPAWSPPFI